MIRNISQDKKHCVSVFFFQPYSLDQILDLLPEKGAMYSGRLNKFSSVQRQREWLAVRVLLYKMTGETKEIGYLDSGKPYLTDQSYQISISHSRGYAAVIISETNRVGIDIEVTGNKALKVAHKFVDEAEVVYPQTDKITREDILTLIWSAKETMYKCMDNRDILFRDELHVDVNIPLFDPPYFHAYETRTSSRQNFKIHYFLEAGEFVLTYIVVEG